MTEQRKAVIKNADMSEDMQQEAVDCASQALSKYNIEKVSMDRTGGAAVHWPKSMQGAWSTPSVMAVLAAGRAGLVVLLGIDCDGGERVMEEQDWHGVLPPPRFSNGLSNGRYYHSQLYLTTTS